MPSAATSTTRPDWIHTIPFDTSHGTTTGQTAGLHTRRADLVSMATSILSEYVIITSRMRRESELEIYQKFARMDDGAPRPRF